jgi:hypothetical protein
MTGRGGLVSELVDFGKSKCGRSARLFVSVVLFGRRTDEVGDKKKGANAAPELHAPFASGASAIRTELQNREDELSPFF